MPEQDFLDWYAGHAKRLGLNPDPMHPAHAYDYYAAFRAGAGPDETGHWPSQFKRSYHPNRYVQLGDGTMVDTISGRPVSPMATQRAPNAPPKVAPLGSAERLQMTPTMNALLLLMRLWGQRGENPQQ